MESKTKTLEEPCSQKWKSWKKGESIMKIWERESNEREINEKNILSKKLLDLPLFLPI